MEVRKQMIGLNKADIQCISLHNKQNAIKVIMNSIYGAFANQYYRFFKIQIADSITFFARLAITTMFKYFEGKYNIKGIYGDSDSVSFDSTILLKNKQYITIQQLFNNSINIFNHKDRQFRASNQQLPYYDQLSNKIQYGKIKYIQRHKVNKQMYQIILQNNNKVIVTEDHSIMIQHNNKLVKKQPSLLKPGDSCISILK